MARQMSAVKKARIRAKADRIQAKMFKDLISHLPRHWDGQCALAHDADVSPQTIWMWVEGRTVSPRINTMVKVAAALGYDIALVKSYRKLRLVKR